MSKTIEEYTNEEYETWRESIVATINTAKMNAALKVNALLLQLYFEIGCAILEKQDSLGWGAQVITRLSSDLQKCYPTERGFSERNLREMKRFAQAYPQFPIWQVPLAELRSGDIWQVELAKLEGQEYLEIDLSKATWYHHISLLSKVKDNEQRAFYYLKTVENEWSRDVMLMQINNNLFNGYGKAINNFALVMPKVTSDLAKSIFKDPYKFGFLAIEEKVSEHTIEQKLIENVTHFLLEMGTGFAYIGHQYHIEVDGKDYYIDILMYNLKLHCYVVIELKAVEFEPEFVSKLNFYVSAIDDTLKTEHENPTIGLLLCSSKSRKTVEYSLRGNNVPLGVASYETYRQVPAGLENILPNEEQLKNLL